jgi:4-aminobutyrate aminotransferase-like enzyme
MFRTRTNSRHFATDMPTDEETISRDCINWIENRLFKTTTPPEEVAGIVLEVVQAREAMFRTPAFVKEIRAYVTRTALC